MMSNLPTQTMGLLPRGSLKDPWNILGERTRGIYTLTPIPHQLRAAPRSFLLSIWHFLPAKHKPMVKEAQAPVS